MAILEELLSDIIDKTVDIKLAAFNIVTDDNLNTITKHVMKKVNKHHGDLQISLKKQRDYLESELYEIKRYYQQFKNEIYEFTGGKESFISHLKNVNKSVQDHAIGVQRVYDEMQSLKLQFSSANLDKLKGKEEDNSVFARLVDDFQEMKKKLNEDKEEEEIEDEIDFKIGDKIWCFYQFYKDKNIDITRLKLEEDTIVTLFGNSVETHLGKSTFYENIFKSKQEAIDAMMKRLEELKC